MGSSSFDNTTPTPGVPPPPSEPAGAETAGSTHQSDRMIALISNDALRFGQKLAESGAVPDAYTTLLADIGRDVKAALKLPCAQPAIEERIELSNLLQIEAARKGRIAGGRHFCRATRAALRRSGSVAVRIRRMKPALAFS